jgi:hypothetical protein
METFFAFIKTSMGAEFLLETERFSKDPIKIGAATVTGLL